MNAFQVYHRTIIVSSKVLNDTVQCTVQLYNGHMGNMDNSLPCSGIINALGKVNQYKISRKWYFMLITFNTIQTTLQISTGPFLVTSHRRVYLCSAWRHLQQIARGTVLNAEISWMRFLDVSSYNLASWSKVPSIAHLSSYQISGSLEFTYQYVCMGDDETYCFKII